MVKKNNSTIQELTKREISRVDTDEKINKYRRDSSRYKRTIMKYKKNEKILNKKVNLLKQKIEFLKENSIGSLYSLSENIIGIKESFLEYCDKFANSTERESLKSFGKEFDYISDFLLNVCNSIELNSNITVQDEIIFDTNSDDDFASNQNNYSDEDSSYELENNDYQWDFKSSTQKNVNENQFASDKIRKLFYETPAENKIIESNIQDENGVFDFSEALNPTMSLSDIMADLLPSKSDNSNSNFVKSQPSKIKEEKKSENLEESEYDAWFLSLQNIIAKETK